MTYAELYERVEALAKEADTVQENDGRLVALILFATLGAMAGAGGGLRALAKLVALWNDAALAGLDARDN